jgi:hypothetical protein
VHNSGLTSRRASGIIVPVEGTGSARTLRRFYKSHIINFCAFLRSRPVPSTRTSLSKGRRFFACAGGGEND